MIDKSKKRKTGSISEDDISTVLDRYSVNTVLALLQEVSQVAGDKIDWNELVKKTTTGISGAREYQMLWRHLAYGQALTDRLDSGADPMDDDSDLEYELEPFPAVGREASAEAAACVKVLIASGYLNDSHIPCNSIIEAPMIINIPNSKVFTTPSDSPILASAMSGRNISVPVFVQKLPLSSGVCGEKRPNNESSGVNLPPRRKRRGWSTEEDNKLAVAVQKHGDRNWAIIASLAFENDRKATELSQRWANLKKKQGSSKVGTSLQHSETQLAAAHRAVSLALDRPVGDNLKATGSTSIVGTRTLPQSQNPSATPTDQQLGRSGPLKSQVPAKWPSSSMNTTSVSDSMVKAAAKAAGARIASSADASSLMEAARSQNVVHITTGISPVMKSSATPIKNQLPSNVHFIRNGLAKAPISAYSTTKPTISRPSGEAQQAQGHSNKPAASVVQSNQVGPTPVTNVTAGMQNAIAFVPSTEHAKTAADSVVSTSTKDKGSDQDNQLAASKHQPEEVGKHQTSALGNILKENSGGRQASTSTPDPISRTQNDRVAVVGGIANNEKASYLAGAKNVDDQCATKETRDNPGSSGRHGDLPGTSVDEK